jgi:2-(1,2-epoxy-1,2-dihydrophenyl)acetyl-CoA isomerase
MSEDDAAEYKTISCTRSGAAATITLNRPERMNAWSDAMSQELLSALREVSADPAMRAVMLTGAGRAFCSGADLKDAMSRGEAGGRDGDRPAPDLAATLNDWYHPIVTSIREMPKPVVSAVNGVAAGAGLSLALAADLVVAAESAYFLLAFVNIGLVPDAGASLFVPSRVGFTRAAQMAMLGERVPAARAEQIGLINSVWPDAEFSGRAEALLARLANGPTRSYVGIKAELNHWMYSRMQEHLAVESAIQGELGGTRDFAEGVAAFMEKRPAKFAGE